MVLGKFRLIEEVQKRPILWDYRISASERNKKKTGEQWADIGKILEENGKISNRQFDDLSSNLAAMHQLVFQNHLLFIPNEKQRTSAKIATVCKRAWQGMRIQFCHETDRILRRVEKAKKEGNYDPNKKYYYWAYFDAMQFIAQGRPRKSTINLSFKNYSRGENNQIQGPQWEHMSDSNSLHTESENNIETMEHHKSDEVQYGKTNLVGIRYESDIEMTDNTNSDQSQKHTNFKNLFTPNESNNISQIIPVYDSDDSAKEDKSFKSYTISLNRLEQESICAQTSNNNIRQNYAAIKEGPELQINAENEFITEIQEKESSSVSTPAQIHCSDSQNLTEDNFNTNDQDYIFLHSFLSTTKIMTPLQTIEFRVSMKSLLMNIFPASSTLNILERQLLLPEDNDPERKFLISFWPFIKSMTLKQSLQFRAKMSDLVLKIISTETNI